MWHRIIFVTKNLLPWKQLTLRFLHDHLTGNIPCSPIFCISSCKQQFSSIGIIGLWILTHLSLKALRWRFTKVFNIWNSCRDSNEANCCKRASLHLRIASQHLQSAHYGFKGCTSGFTKEMDFIYQYKRNVAEERHSSTVTLSSSKDIKFLKSIVTDRISNSRNLNIAQMIRRYSTSNTSHSGVSLVWMRGRRRKFSPLEWSRLYQCITYLEHLMDRNRLSTPDTSHLNSWTAVSSLGAFPVQEPSSAQCTPVDSRVRKTKCT